MTRTLLSVFSLLGGQRACTAVDRTIFQDEDILVGRMTTMKFGAILAAFSMLAGSPALAAAGSTSPASSILSPWVALSALSGTASSTALCASAVAGSSAATQGQAPGCVLPLVDALPPVVESVPMAAPVAVASGGGLGFLPLLLGLAAAAGAVALLLSNSEDGKDISPVPATPF